MNHFALVLIAALSMSLPTFAQKRPTTLPAKTTKSKTQFEEPPTVVPTATPSVAEIQSTAPLSEQDQKNSKEYFFFRPAEGFPQQQIGLAYEAAWLRSKWSFHDADFNYESKASPGYALAYRYLFSPEMNVELSYKQDSFKVDADSGNGLNLMPSRANVDSIFARVEYSWLQAKRYFSSYGVALEFGQEGYPTLEFIDANNVELVRARDLVVGLSLQSQLYILQPFSYRLKAGLDQGLNAKHLGGPETKKYQSYFAKAGVEYMIDPQNSLEASVEYRVRSTTSSGKRGAEEVEWDNESHTTTALLGFNYTF